MAVWRTVCVRAAGFPAADVLEIADADCAAAADHLNAVEAESEALRQAALEAIRGELEGAPKERLDVLVKAIRKVKRPVAAASPQLERKPFYLDLESPVLVEILAKAIRRAEEEVPGASVSLSEMLPGHDQLWLPDAQGNQYTCELRLVVLDRD